MVTYLQVTINQMTSTVKQSLPVLLYSDQYAILLAAKPKRTSPNLLLLHLSQDIGITVPSKKQNNLNAKTMAYFFLPIYLSIYFYLLRILFH